LHALRAQILLLQLPARGDVLERTLDPGDGTSGVAFRLGADAYPLSRAFGGENFRFEVECRAVLPAGMEGGHNLLPPGVRIERQRVRERRYAPAREAEDVEQLVGPEYVLRGQFDRPAARARQPAGHADHRVLLPCL